jgi:hypothetical protein
MAARSHERSILDWANCQALVQQQHRPQSRITNASTKSCHHETCTDTGGDALKSPLLLKCHGATELTLLGDFDEPQAVLVELEICQKGKACHLESCRGGCAARRDDHFSQSQFGPLTSFASTNQRPDSSPQEAPLSFPLLQARTGAGNCHLQLIRN